MTLVKSVRGIDVLDCQDWSRAQEWRDYQKDPEGVATGPPNAAADEQAQSDSDHKRDDCSQPFFQKRTERNGAGYHIKRWCQY